MTIPGTPGGIPPRQKAAILCVTLGLENAAAIFKHLPDELVERLTVEMVRITEVPAEHAELVHREMAENVLAHGYLAEGGFRYARDVLMHAVGESRANAIFERLATYMKATPFEFLRESPPDQIAAFLRGEHPQTIALVIVNLPSNELAAKVMQMIPAAEQADVAMRIALMHQTPPDVVKDVASVMEAKLETVLRQEYSAARGVGSLADILNNSDRGTERNVLEFLAGANHELAEEVRSLLFVFDDLLKLDDRTIQLVLKEIDSKDLALALRGTADEVKERILSNISQRAAEMVRDEMTLMPPQRRRVVEEAQSKVVAAVRKLEDAGMIALARGEADEDELVA
ncbi:MAG: flagellar motor switch protein FliG [Chloroflexota bacterium]|nr:flagellar motor switch protein FliG [Chloroflexota bacterium]